MASRKQRSDRQAGKRQFGTGRLSQAAEFERARLRAQADTAEWEAMSAAMQARHRLHGIAYPPVPSSTKEIRDKPHVLDQRAGSFVGRLAMQGEISTTQHDAAIKYAEDVDNYRRAISAPPQPGAVDLNAVRGGGVGGPDHVAFVARAVRRYMGERDNDGRYRGGVTGAIRDCQCEPSNRSMNLHAALDYLVLRDEPHQHMVLALRVVLNALAKHYKFFNDREEAA